MWLVLFGQQVNAEIPYYHLSDNHVSDVATASSVTTAKTPLSLSHFQWTRQSETVQSLSYLINASHIPRF